VGSVEEEKITVTRPVCSLKPASLIATEIKHLGRQTVGLSY